VRGLVSPAEFIPLAEEIGLIDLLGEWVLRTACRAAAGWPEPRDGPPLRIAVNVSPLQLRDARGLLAGIQRALAEASLPAERLEIELTENALACDVAETLTAIRRMGCSLSLDDFGTGYSSLGRLRHHPFERIKIDRSFVADLGRGEGGSGRQTGEWMIRAIASLGLGLGMATVIEGIETAEQWALAKAAGCTEMQGYLVSRPVPAMEVQALIHRLEQEAR
jgi:EAL domain-containing protein (putative c-di-GMP-specific phosphodiesterase class I)